MRAPARPIATPPSARPRSNDAPESKPHLARWQLRRGEPSASRRRAPGRAKGRALLGGILSPMRGRAERWASARRRVCRLRACPARRATPCLARRRAPFTADGAVLPSIRIAACVEAANAPSAAPGGRRQPAMARAPGGARRGGLRGARGLKARGKAARPGARGLGPADQSSARSAQLARHRRRREGVGRFAGRGPRTRDSRSGWRARGRARERRDSRLRKACPCRTDISHQPRNAAIEKLTVRRGWRRSMGVVARILRRLLLLESSAIAAPFSSASAPGPRRRDIGQIP